MGHYAKVLDGKVLDVMTCDANFFLPLSEGGSGFIDTSAGNWIQTSYNTIGNVHLNGGTPLRGNYAGIGYTYDAVNDVFYEPQPYPSWTLSQNTWLWQPPVPYPETGEMYIWDEAIINWVYVPPTV